MAQLLKPLNRTLLCTGVKLVKYRNSVTKYWQSSLKQLSMCFSDGTLNKQRHLTDSRVLFSLKLMFISSKKSSFSHWPKIFHASSKEWSFKNSLSLIFWIEVSRFRFLEDLEKVTTPLENGILKSATKNFNGKYFARDIHQTESSSCKLPLLCISKISK